MRPLITNIKKVERDLSILSDELELLQHNYDALKACKVDGEPLEVQHEVEKLFKCYEHCLAQELASATAADGVVAKPAEKDFVAQMKSLFEEHHTKTMADVRAELLKHRGQQRRAAQPDPISLQTMQMFAEKAVTEALQRQPQLGRRRPHSSGAITRASRSTDAPTPDLDDSESHVSLNGYNVEGMQDTTRFPQFHRAREG